MSPLQAGLAAAIPLLAGACSSANAPPAAPQAAEIAPLPQGGGCGPAIARTQAMVDSDVATGNLNKSVGERFGADLRQAATACSAGRERDALGLLAAAKTRYGYP